MEPEPAPVRHREEERTLEPSYGPVAAETSLPSREMGEKACQVLKEVLGLMSLEATLSRETREEGLVSNIAGTAEGLVIGGKGQSLDAHEHLLHRRRNRSEESDGQQVLAAVGCL